MPMKRLVWLTLYMSLALCFASGEADVTILNYNVNSILAAGPAGREALQRIVDHFDPDIIVFQEAKGTTNPDDFLSVNTEEFRRTCKLVMKGWLASQKQLPPAGPTGTHPRTPKRSRRLTNRRMSTALACFE